MFVLQTVPSLDGHTMENPTAPHSLEQQLEAEALNSDLGWCLSRAILREVDFTPCKSPPSRVSAVEL